MWGTKHREDSRFLGQKHFIKKQPASVLKPGMMTVSSLCN